MLGNIKWFNIHNWSHKNRGENGKDEIFKKIMTENLSNVMKDINLYYQKAQEILKGINAEENIPRYFTVKTAEN